MKVFDVLEWLTAMCSHVPNKRGTDGPLLCLFFNTSSNFSTLAILPWLKFTFIYPVKFFCLEFF